MAACIYRLSGRVDHTRPYAAAPSTGERRGRRHRERRVDALLIATRPMASFPAEMRQSILIDDVSASIAGKLCH